MKPVSPAPLDWLGQIARALTIVVLGYWALYAIIAPVTIWDAQVYNLARLPLAEKGGLFNNTHWTSERQLIFPWTFDALHWPLLHLGWGFALPSFLCLLGTLSVAWSLLHRWHDKTTAWVGCLALLALPTFVYQGVSTKNDIPIVLGIAVWLHSLLSWKDSGRRVHLLFCACALGFSAGVKTSGILPAFLCGLTTLIMLRHQFRGMILFIAATVLSLALWGSGETYFEAYRQYGSPLGPPAFAHAHRNNDGAKGAIANSIRYTFANINIGAESEQQRKNLSSFLEQKCRQLLQLISLSNSGYRSDFNDAKLEFLKTGGDSASDYGILGTAGLVLALLTLIWWQPRELWWRLSVCSIISAGGVCYSVAWMPWNNRFLLLTFAALTVALASFFRRYNARWLMIAFAAVSGIWAIQCPFISFNKKPRDLVQALTERDSYQFRERPSMAPIVRAAREWQAANPDQQLWLLPGTDSWVLPFLSGSNPNIEIIDLRELKLKLENKPPAKMRPALLVLNRPDFRVASLPLKVVQKFADEQHSTLYEYEGTGANPTAPRADLGDNFYNDGWSGCDFSIRVRNWRTSTVGIEASNPTSLKRTVTLQSGSNSVTFVLEPGAKTTIELRVQPADNILGTVAPPFVPGGADTRLLGVRLNVIQ